METSYFVVNAWLCIQLDHGAAHLGAKSFFQRDVHNTETVLFTIIFSFLLYGPRSVTRQPIAHEVNRCTFWTSCTFVSWKRPLLCMMHNFWCIWITKRKILIGRVLHTYTESTLKMSYLVYVCLLSARDVWWTKGDTIVQEELLIRCTIVPWKLRIKWLMRDFAYSWITEQPILVGGNFSRETHITQKPFSSPCFSLSCFMGRGV